MLGRRRSSRLNSQGVITRDFNNKSHNSVGKFVVVDSEDDEPEIEKTVETPGSKVMTGTAGDGINFNEQKYRRLYYQSQKKILELTKENYELVEQIQISEDRLEHFVKKTYSEHSNFLMKLNSSLKELREFIQRLKIVFCLGLQHL